MTEEWRDIPGYHGRYQVSSRGRVRSVFKCQYRQTTRGRLSASLHQPQIIKPMSNGNVCLYNERSKKKYVSIRRLYNSAFTPRFL